ncbi:SDR family NAD(P)-dependent oxidoreductase [Hyphococcus formosus]|uniref:SDR family NAD(P)-dependent oxidoreductase n=1 Tax=Hyphococcus formosus TaxID=3143534 RepID=UPI00398B5440
MKNFPTVLVTGASSGIGKAVALRYLKAGSVVGICGRNKEALEEIRLDHPKAYPLIFDTTDHAATVSAINQFIGEAGPLNLAILNAGNHKPTDARDFKLSAYKAILDINYFGTLNCLDAVIPAMQQQGSGTIAIVGSVAGYVGLPQAGAYCASKAAIMRLSETLRAELRPQNIDVKLISPGFVKTPLTDKNDFEMPFLMELDAATDRIIKGISGHQFETVFPRRLAWSLKFLATIPKSFYFRLTKKMLRDRPDAS